MAPRLSPRRGQAVGLGPQPSRGKAGRLSHWEGWPGREAGWPHPAPRALPQPPTPTPRTPSAGSRPGTGGGVAPVPAWPGWAAGTPSRSPEGPEPSPTPRLRGGVGLRAWLSVHLGITWPSWRPHAPRGGHDGKRSLRWWVFAPCSTWVSPKHPQSHPRNPGVSDGMLGPSPPPAGHPLGSRGPAAPSGGA